jgi:thioredoxin 1
MAKKETVQELTSKEFSLIIKDKKNSLIICDFYAEWCMPCIMMAPVMESLAERNKKIKFIKINVDEAGALANDYQVTSIPCIVFFKEGEEVDRIVGNVDEAYLEEKIRDYSK